MGTFHWKKRQFSQSRGRGRAKRGDTRGRGRTGTPCGREKHCRFWVILGPLSNRGRSSIWNISILIYVSAHLPLQKVFRVVSAPSTLNDTIMEYLGHHGKSGRMKCNHRNAQKIETSLRSDLYLTLPYINKKRRLYCGMAFPNWLRNLLDVRPKAHIS